MERNIEIIGFVFSTIIMLYIAYKTFHFFISSNKLNQIITDYYLEIGLDVTSISLLNLTERIKYGVPILIFRFYNYYFGIFSGKIDYVRKIEIEKNEDTILINYVELQISKNKVISFKEFDSYEI